MITLLITGAGAAPVSAADSGSSERVERNVIYGMYSGLALLLDVHRPEQSNGRGIIFVPGSGWVAAPDPGTKPLKDESQQVPLFVPKLLSAGYTVFVINHRAAPQFHYPIQVADTARAVRFVRQHAAKYGIDPERIGALGYSSGANLVGMLATNADATKASGGDAVSQKSARISCAVVFATPADLTMPTIAQGVELLTMYVGVPVEPQNAPAQRLLREASPVTYASADDAPVLLIHGNADKLVPIDGARNLSAALKNAGVAAKVIEIEGAGHWPVVAPNRPDPRQEMIRWFDQYLAPGAMSSSTQSPQKSTSPSQLH